ncbi:hypothetical protein QMM42_13765 [Leptospira santarosai]|uniref:Uncharacterized protein n=2 Tax=Leptospira santarosai TaxID=28183 RepID=A0A2P1QQP6_9LEPT|nr:MULTISPECIES: hypothetical protein [Leptospira]AVQ11235.1 Uncharacterized protein XB16_0900 [Leptospira santarosai]AVV48701.1 Uncharacterized protein XB17_00076 [Leptospira santarosai]MDI7187259.1 hypothetical protein [Leptospira santarosai]MDI7201129.1 hypothetical protein [Leptospira santarosai]MDI7212242.1 hypothetical protein [Leptospira santarosai]
MKINILKLSVIFILTFQIVSCSIGSAREACKNNLKKGSAFDDSDDSCEMLSYLPLAHEPNQNGINFLLLNCYQYYEKLQKCNKEEKKYLPAIYSKE